MNWNSTLYDNKHDFVAEYGKELLELIPENRCQRILDLGCGTGTLTVQLAKLADQVIGIDSSENMIEKAKGQFPELTFMVGNALDLPFENKFDVVFSNAVFHWISDHDTLLRNVHKVLKPQGLLVCEFGADGNIRTIEQAFMKACGKQEYDYRPKFNFPTPEEFGKQLESNGFVVEKVYAFDRPTLLKDHEHGLANWLRQFYASELESMPEDVGNSVIKEVEELTRETLWNGKEWTADYRRLRAIAKAGDYDKAGNGGSGEGTFTQNRKDVLKNT